MLALSAFTVLLALLQDYQPLALFAILGGFVAPILVSSGSRNHVALFAIYSLLNLEILVLAFKRNWRLLNRMGFVLTVGIAAAWGFRDWRPELFDTVEPFLLIFLVTYTLISLCPERKSERADVLLAVSVPFSFFFLQMRAVGHFEFGMAFTCLGLGLWNLLLSAWLYRRGRTEGTGGIRQKRQNSRVLLNLYGSLCVLFSNLAAPYAFENTASFAIWAVEGAFLTVAACRWGSYKLLLGSVALHLGALGLCGPILTRVDWTAASPTSPLLVSGLLFAFAHWISGFWATRFHPLAEGPLVEGPLVDEWEEKARRLLQEDNAVLCGVLSWAFTVVGSLWWWATVYDQIPRWELSWLSPFAVICLAAPVGCWLSERLGWRAGRFLLMGPIVSAFLRVQEKSGFFRGVFGFFAGRAFPPTLPSPVYAIDALVYLCAVGGSLYLLRKATKTALRQVVLFAALLDGFFLVEAAIYQWGAGWWQNALSSLPLLATLVCVRRPAKGLKKIVEDYKNSFVAACGVFLLFRAPLFLSTLTSRGSAVNGVFIPLLNPLELWQGIFIVSFILCVDFAVPKEHRPKNASPAPYWSLIPLLTCFVWLKLVAMRGTWHYLAVSSASLWDVAHTAHGQAVIAILWGAQGLGAILCGQKMRSRKLWYAGTGLVAIDMIKLLLVDLNRVETLTRILAFLVLGGFFFLIGWAAPLPPKEK
jgi:uncharacterized membrane protein